MKGIYLVRKSTNLALLFCVLSILALALPLGAVSSRMYDRLATRPGSLPWMRLQAVGSVVTLDAMLVDEIGDGFIIVKEPCLCTEKVSVQAYARVEKWQSVEVTGTIALDAESRMYIQGARVYVYADSKGNIMPIVPKSIVATRDFWTKIDVTLSEADSALPIRGDMESSMVLDSMGGGFNADTTPIARIKQLPDDTIVEVRNKWVSNQGGWNDISGTYHQVFWIEEADRSAGIKVMDDQYLATGFNTIISFTAQLATVEGQRVLTDIGNVSSIDAPSNFVPPVPWGMPCKTVGGPPLNATQNFSGLDNTGLLVATWGNVVSCTYDSGYTDYINIDDGSGVPMRVEVPGTTTIYSSMKRVTGISDTIYRSDTINREGPNGLSGMPDDYVRRIVCRNTYDVVTPGSTSTSTPQGTVSGNLIAYLSPDVPVRVYTSGGST
ncbi:MAG: hypothetical protein ACYC0V_21585, partial [Armatimonadota bacterium]